MTRVGTVRTNAFVQITLSSVRPILVPIVSLRFPQQPTKNIMNLLLHKIHRKLPLTPRPANIQQNPQLVQPRPDPPPPPHLLRQRVIPHPLPKRLALPHVLPRPFELQRGDLALESGDDAAKRPGPSGATRASRSAAFEEAVVLSQAACGVGGVSDVGFDGVGGVEGAEEVAVIVCGRGVMGREGGGFEGGCGGRWSVGCDFGGFSVSPLSSARCIFTFECLLFWGWDARRCRARFHVIFCIDCRWWFIVMDVCLGRAIHGRFFVWGRTGYPRRRG
ncbi:hypothetical protein ACHAW6_009267 [Cyclotella cf. meneghiniana]